MHYDDLRGERDRFVESLLSDLAKDETIASLLQNDDLQDVQVIWKRCGNVRFQKQLVLNFENERVTLEIEKYRLMVER